ncbi:unnamed protein product [Closterium sp. Naga37s-1]|nr:unnamed protein product [Closterium sp. Naga37s-1]
MAQEARPVPAALLAAEPNSAAEPHPYGLASDPAATTAAKQAVLIRVTKESHFSRRTRQTPLPSTTVILELQNHLILTRGLLFAVHIRVTKEADFIKRRRHPPSTTVVLELQTHLTLKRGLLFGPDYACTVLRSSAGAKGRGYRLYLHRVDEPLLRVWNTSNVIVQRVQMSQPFRAYSQACPKEIPEVGTDIICPLIHVYRSYGVQIVKGYTFGRVDIMRTMHSRIDSMRMTGVSDFKRGNGVIRVMLSGYGPLLVRAYIYITNNEIYGGTNHVCLLSGYAPLPVRAYVYITNNEIYALRAMLSSMATLGAIKAVLTTFMCMTICAYMPVLLHVGAVGVVVRNNYVHDFVFAGITCGNMVHSQGDCMLSSISRNLVVAAGRNVFNRLIPPPPHLPLSPRSATACSAPSPTTSLSQQAGTSQGAGTPQGYTSNRIEHVVMKGTEGTPGWNRIEHVVMKGTEGTPGWCACITATICNCLKDPGNYWDRMRAKYYSSAAFQQHRVQLPQVLQQCSSPLFASIE